MTRQGLLLLGLCSLVFELVSSSGGMMAAGDVTSCRGTDMAVFNLTMVTFWTQDLFPKQYPLFRPHAQWSKLLGRTHSESYHLWSEGSHSSVGVKEFAEKGTTVELEKETQGRDGIMDAFTAPSIPRGSGDTSVLFIADLQHHKLSTMARIIPSPDWFVGLDNFSLCDQDGWLEEISFDLTPMDAGTDRGFTFTAPNWAESPLKPITEISAHFPNHPANSFYYPRLDKLPTLVKVTIRRVDGPDAEENSGHGYQQDYMPIVKDATPSPEVRQQHQPPVGSRNNNNNNNLASTIPTEPAHHQGDRKVPNNAHPVNLAAAPVGRRKESIKVPIVPETSDRYRTGAEPETASDEVSREREVAETRERRVRERQEAAKKEKERKERERQIRRENKRKQRKARKQKKQGERESTKPVDCVIEQWSEWAACSKSCGYGTRMRTRSPQVEPRHGGSPCPLMTEEELCGSMRSCGWKHFSFSRWSNPK